MMDTDGEFRKRLLATFREEAEEHLTEITQDLISLEKAEPGAGAEFIEKAYRKTHSLKGAARAVQLREIESVCQNLETVFSAMKKGNYVPDAEAFDLFHEALKIIQALMGDDPTPAATAREINTKVRRLTDGRNAAGMQKPPGPSNKPVPRDPDPGKAAVRTAAQEPALLTGRDRVRNSATESPAPQIPLPGVVLPRTSFADTHTVRIAADKLDRLISGSDDLLTTRLFLAHRMQELEDMITRFGLWRWNYTLVSNDMHRIREMSFGKRRAELPADLVLPLQRIVEFLEYNREFIAVLQHDLGAHIQETEIDRSALESSTQTISDLIHDAVLLPISNVLVMFNGLVRDYSRKTGKQVDLVIEGGEIEMDRRILEALKDPFMHLIHNSIDHGIEYPDIRTQKGKSLRGTVRIRVVPLSGSKVSIEISDDGVGIDPAGIRQVARDRGFITENEGAGLSDNEILWLVFKSGLSTSPFVTDLSGRGLGLAIVEDTATRLGGKVSIASGPDTGTTVRIMVPVRLATLRGVVVRAGNQRYVLPMQQVRQVIRVKNDAIIIRNERPSLLFQGEMISTIRLTDALGIPATRIGGERKGQVPVIILAYGAGQIACIVDEIQQVQEIVIRPLGSQLRRVRRITGAVILGDGTLALVLDPLELIQESLKGTPITSRDLPGQLKEKNVLVVEDSVTSRTLLQTILERAGYLVQTATDGIEALALLKERPFDLVVSDIDMPRMNGFTLTEKIRADERLVHLPVVLVTSLDSDEDRNHGLVVGADAYIVKSSFDRHDILDVIANLVTGRKSPGGV
ncbi:MAG: response regulator [Methanomicrobiales archaeon]|nr:response regulator [Methanomicrobiales archaeon]